MPTDAQIMRAFLAVVAGFVLAFWVIRPICQDPNVRTALPELRTLYGVQSLVI